ncbi:MAG: relaxase domain-containing protein [Acidobacteriota bacterium]|nr:relaxase domain-containing protein [Acidobacteriota bacterium]
MMTMSKALGAAQAKAYYQSEYSNSRENYYTEGEQVVGEWSGKLAEELGLEGPVEREQFERLMDGQDPRTGEQLVKHVAAKEYVNEFGDTVKTSEHRAGWDATFSAPKSVSIAALIGGDKRLVAAHEKSADAALRAVETDMQARLGGNTPAETTGKIIAAKFQHDAARPDRETGYAAPQLHTHVVIANLTRTADNQMRPVQPKELYRSQGLGTAVYRANLAVELNHCGYDYEIDGRTGAPEIKGLSKDYLQANSPRSLEVQREAAEMKARLAEQGITVKEGAGLNQAAARVDRKSKRYDRAEMQQRHAEMDARFGHQARAVVAQALERGSIEHSREEITRRAQESVTFARDHAMEREAVASLRKVTTDALRRNLGLTTYEAVKEELSARERRGEFVGIVREHQPPQITTRRMLDMEHANIRRVLVDQGQGGVDHG